MEMKKLTEWGFEADNITVPEERKPRPHKFPCKRCEEKGFTRLYEFNELMRHHEEAHQAIKKEEVDRSCQLTIR